MAQTQPSEPDTNMSPPNASRLRRLGVNLLVAFISLLFASLLAETVFRFAGIGRLPVPIWQMDPRAFRPDPNPELVFTLTPGFVGKLFHTPAQYNSLGMRADEIPPDKPPGEFRILALGDSITYGFGVPLQETFVKKLAARLSDLPGLANDRVFRICNAGVPAYNTRQEYLFLERLVEPVQPDLVILNFTITNDYQKPHRLDANGYIEPADLDPEDFRVNIPLEGSLGRISYVYRFVSEKIRQRILEPRRLALIESIFAAYREDKQGWRDSKACLLKMKRLLDERGCRFALFIYPDPTRPPAYRREDYRFLEIHEMMEKFCRQNEIPYLDLLDDFLAHRNKAELFVIPTDAHPSPLAHRMVAKGLVRELRKQGLLSPNPYR